MLPSKSLETVKEVCNNFHRVGRKDIDCVFQLLNDEDNNEVFDKCSLLLMPLLVEYLTEENYAAHAEMSEGCVELLNLIAQHSDAEITGDHLTNMLESADCNKTFVILLQALLITLCRHPECLEGCWSRSLFAIRGYLEEGDVPNQSPKAIIELYENVADFYETAINAIEHPAMFKEVMPFLIQLLGIPVCFKQDASSKSLKFEFGMVMSKLVANIFRTLDDPLEFVHHPPDCLKFDPDELAIAHLFYWVFYEGVCLQAVPKVYSPNFVFQLSVDLLCKLLQSEHDGLVEKALKLASHLLIRLNEEKRSYLLLEQEANAQFLTLLATAVVYNNCTEIRQMALKCLTTFILQFDAKGVYLIVKHLLDVQSHSGLKGYLITLYKDQFHREWDDLSEYFKGVHLKRFLRCCCRLKKEEDSELSEDSEQIVAALNFIRYLLLKDRNNVTQVADWLPLLERGFLVPLRKSLQLSKNRLEHDIKNTVEDITVPEEMTVIVAGKDLEQSSKEERIASLKSSLMGLDVIESVFMRVMELLEGSL